MSIYACPPVHRKHVLFVWRNGPAVVVGRHQNVWAECDVELAQRLGVCVARRKSGGGAVFHDLGNLNISLISPRTIQATTQQRSTSTGAPAETQPHRGQQVEANETSGRGKSNRGGGGVTWAEGQEVGEGREIEKPGLAPRLEATDRAAHIGLVRDALANRWPTLAQRLSISKRTDILLDRLFKVSYLLY